MAKQATGIGLFGLIGLVVSSCIGSGIFALAGQMAFVSSPGAALIAWAICGVGFATFALSLANLGAKRPDLEGIFEYGAEGFGPFAGFLSGWGYWLSAWLGSIGFAIMVMLSLGLLAPDLFADDVGRPNVVVIVLISVFNWAITFLVIRGVESAAFVNAVVMVVKIVALLLFIGFMAAFFQAGVFTADFWGNVYNAAVMSGQGVPLGGVAFELGSVPDQVIGCLVLVMWVFIGIEGATVMSARARNRADVGKAAILGLAVLLALYVGASILPYGVMPYDQIMELDAPAAIELFEYVAPGWGGAFLSTAIVVSVLGAWISWTILPAETVQVMAHKKLMPASWGRLNRHGAPHQSLLVIAVCIQVVLLVVLMVDDAYTFAISVATMAIIVSWALASAYQVKLSLQHHEIGQAVLGAVATVFLVAGGLLSGWGFFLLACIGYLPGVFFYWRARRENGHAGLSQGEKIATCIMAACAVVSIVLVAAGIIPIF